VTVHKGEIFQLIAVFQSGCVKLAQVAISECDIARQATHTGLICECVDAEEEQISNSRVRVATLKMNIWDLISRKEIVRDVVKIRLGNVVNIKGDNGTIRLVVNKCVPSYFRTGVGIIIRITFNSESRILREAVATNCVGIIVGAV
jgi:hypothetical protein